MPTKPQPVHRLLAVSASRACATRRAEQNSLPTFSPGCSCTASITFCRHEIRWNSRTSWNERTSPQPGDLVGRQPDEFLAVEEDRAAVGLDEAGEEVEHRGLAGAVRADERGDRALAQLDVQVVGGDDAAEALATRPCASSTTGALVPPSIRAPGLFPRRSACR